MSLVLNIRVDDLQVLYICLRTKSLLTACKDLNLTQPAITARINKLRDYFDDELIYRVGNKMQLTKRGEQLIKPLHLFHQQVDEILPKESFDPYKDTSHFNIYISEGYAIVKNLIPNIIERIQYYNPLNTIDIQVVSLDWTPQPSYREYLDFDVCIGISLQPEGYSYDLLTEQHFAIVYDKFPIKDNLSFEEYLLLPHIGLNTINSSANRFLTYFNNIDPRENIKIRIASLHVLKNTLSNKYVALLTKDLAKHLELNSIDLPLKMDPIYAYLMYHERLKFNSKNIWLRRLIKSEINKII